MCTHIYIHTAHTHMYTHAYAHTHMHAHTHVHTHTYTQHTHTHTHTHQFTSQCSFMTSAYLFSDVYAPLVWTVLIPLVCGLVVLCVLCLPCCVACHLYRKKKNSVVSSAPRHTSDDETVRYVATESEEQARVKYLTLSPPNYYDEVGDHSNARVDQDDTQVYETAPDGTRPEDPPPEWTANPTSNHELPTGECSTLQSAAGDHEPLTEGYSTLQHACEYRQPFQPGSYTYQ